MAVLQALHDAAEGTGSLHAKLSAAVNEETPNWRLGHYYRTSCLHVGEQKDQANLHCQKNRWKGGAQLW